MHHGGPLLFMAQANGAQVVPGRTTPATATIALIVSPDDGAMRYDLTYNGLERGPPARIALYNFGAGGNGATVAILCGSGAEACPERASARVAGSARAVRWSQALLSEIISGRTYVQIDGGNGTPEIRGQLQMNGAMTATRNYVSHLVPRREAGATGEGTAVLTETYLPGGRVAVNYSVTVAGTSGAPEAVALSGVADPAQAEAARFLKSRRLPIVLRAVPDRRQGGGSFSGKYVARRSDASALLAVKLLDQRELPALTVQTSRFPRGELSGVFTPVE